VARVERLDATLERRVEQLTGTEVGTRVSRGDTRIGHATARRGRRSRLMSGVFRHLPTSRGAMGGKILYNRCPGIVRIPHAAYHRDPVGASGDEPRYVLGPHAADRDHRHGRIACEAPDEPRPAIDIACSTVRGCMSDNDPACSTLLRRLCV